MNNKYLEKALGYQILTLIAFTQWIDETNMQEKMLPLLPRVYAVSEHIANVEKGCKEENEILFELNSISKDMMDFIDMIQSEHIRDSICL